MWKPRVRVHTLIRKVSAQQLWAGIIVSELSINIENIGISVRIAQVHQR